MISNRFSILSLVAVSLLAALPAAADFNYEALVSLIESRRVTSVETLLPLLPTELRGNYALMHSSRSLQAATPETPRVILFGKDGRLTCAFAGTTTGQGSDFVECIQFRREERAFDFRQITFPTAENRLERAVFSKRGMTNDGRKCAGCHGGADPRPNWGAYPNWLGAYGSKDDSLFPTEVATYESFVKARGNHPRYRHLIQGPEPRAPYLANGDLAFRPNLRLTEMFSRMNALRTARVLASSGPRWRGLAFAVTTLGCGFDPAQTSRLRASRRPYGEDLRLANLYKSTGLEPNQWTTRILNEGSGDPRTGANRYEFQSGYSYFSHTTAIAVVQEEAKTDDRLRSAIRNMIPFTRYDDYSREFFRHLDRTLVPDPYFFSPEYSTNLKAICPTVADRFVDHYVKTDRY